MAFLLVTMLVPLSTQPQGTLPASPPRALLQGPLPAAHTLPSGPKLLCLSEPSPSLAPQGRGHTRSFCRANPDLVLSVMWRVLTSAVHILTLVPRSRVLLADRILQMGLAKGLT